MVLPKTASKPKLFRIAVMSDLHCRLASDADDSFLTVGALRKPATRHPVEALLELVKSRKLTADVLLAPGDLSNKVSLEGLSQAWDLLQEVGAALAAEEVVPVLGNHDVDSKKRHNADANYFIRCLRPGFPFRRQEVCNAFLSEGSAVLNVQEKLDLILVNSVIDHNDERTAKRGGFSDSRIDVLGKRLKNELTAPIRVCMLHHHPVLHTGPYLDSKDVIPNGDALVETLRSADCRFIIHGHKHHPRLLTIDGTTVFAAGSFSANLGRYGSSVGNLFHIIEFDESLPCRGRILTWAFQLTKGWLAAHREFSGFPYSAGFGASLSIDAAANKLEALAKTKTAANEFEISENEVLEAIPDIPFVSPSQYKELGEVLRARGMKLQDPDHGVFDIGVCSRKRSK